MGREKVKMPKITTWRDALAVEKEKSYFKSLLSWIETERAAGKVIYPPNKDVFNALSFTPLENVKVVILGQDPYHGPGQAHGLCFSVQHGVKPPPSLVNIFKELENDLKIPRPKHGCLESWAKQGVLMLNSVLTVEAGKPLSHAGRGWETFTDAIIDIVNQETVGTAFLLWGSPAQKKGSRVDRKKHLVLETVHPSPLSAHRGFLGCGHFGKVNRWLEEKNMQQIDWRVE